LKTLFGLTNFSLLMAKSTILMPSYIPDYRVGTLAFETGLPDSLALQDQIANTTMLSCSMCYGLMQRPLHLPHCSHGVCEPCLIKYWRCTLQNVPHGMMHCPICRADVPSIYSLRQFSRFSDFEKRWYRILDVHCPNECGVSLPLIEIREHRIRFCKRRIVECPNFTCTVVCISEELPNHFQKCEESCVLSSCCSLPINPKKTAKHDCEQLSRKLFVSNRERYTLGGESFRIAFKRPSKPDFETINDYISSIENHIVPDIPTYSSRGPNGAFRNGLQARRRLPQRPLPSYMASDFDPVPEAVRVIVPNDTWIDMRRVIRGKNFQMNF